METIKSAAKLKSLENRFDLSPFESARKDQQEKTYAQEITKMRFTHYMIYLSWMGVHPLLQHLHSAQPSNQELLQATAAADESLKKEKEFLDDLQGLLNQPVETTGRTQKKSMTFDSDILALLKYQAEVEEVLVSNPEFCGIGISLHQIAENQKLSENTLMMIAGIPLVALGLLFPPTLGLAYLLQVGAASSGIAVYQLGKEYEKDKVVQTARLQREKSDDFAKLVQDFNQSVSKQNGGWDKIRKQLNENVTSVYRMQLDRTRQDQVDLKIAAALTPILIAAPLASNLIRSSAADLLKVFATVPK